MQKHNRDPKTSRKARRPVRVVAMGFVLSVALPIGWGLTRDSASAQERPANFPVAPKTTAELFALAVDVAKKQQGDHHTSRGVGDAGERANSPSPTRFKPSAGAPAGSPSPQSVRDAIDPEEAPSLLARATENPELAPTPSRVPRPLRPVAAQAAAALAHPEAAAPTASAPAPARKDETPVLLAQSGVAQTRVSAAALLERTAAAPQLSAVGAVTSQAAREVAQRPRASSASTPSSNGGPRITETSENPSREKGSGPTPATRKEIEAARAARHEALSGGAPQTTRRRVAMHRMAAAAASSLNEATPFRTASSGSSRFSGASAGDSLGQTFDAAAQAVSVVPGLRLENVQLGFGYSSNGLPGARSLYSSGLGADTDYSARATLAYRKRFRNSSFGLTYTPSRNQRYRFSEWNSTDHILGLDYDRQLGRRWGLGLNASAANTGLEQFWFRQPVYRRVENPPATFDELVQRVEAGEFTDEEFASIITGAPIVEEPGGRELELTRVNSLNAAATASYAHSARSTFSFGIGANRYETSTPFRTGDRDFAVNDLQRQFAYFETAYRSSASMTTGVRYNLTGNDSTFGRSYSQSASMFVRRRLSRFWSAEVQGGGGYSSLDVDEGYLGRLTNVRNSIPNWTAGGSLNYRYGGHAFELFGRRQIGDSLGLSSATSVNGGLSWQWTTPRIPWVFSGGASYSRSDWGFSVVGDSSRSYETTLLQAGLSRRISPTTAFSTGYYFGRYESPFTGLLTGSTIHRVQAVFLWRPIEAR